jgi:Flp pilus assembly protein TadG
MRPPPERFSTQERASQCPRLDRTGAALVVAAVMILMFLSMAALAIDYGMVKTAKAEAQRAMDAAALAGASVFLEPNPAFNRDSGARARAKEIAVKHTVHRVVVDSSPAHMTVTPDLVAKTVRADYTVPPISLWFARRFGSSTMGLTASATAKASQTGNATCVKPVAIPDIWNNVDPGLAEDKNGNHLWDYDDEDGNGKWDDGETEPWAWTAGDVYDSATTGYGSTFRNPYGTGYQVKVKDYGRQIMLTTFSPKDASVSSMYYSWGETTGHTNADTLAARIRGESCVSASVQTPYKAANGGKIGPLQAAWADLIDNDPSAHWDDASNTVVGSSSGTNWLEGSKRVIVVGLYDPSKYSSVPSGNDIQFVNLAKVWVDERPCGGAPGTCKSPITARFLGFLGGGPSGPNTGNLVWHLTLIK